MLKGTGTNAEAAMDIENVIGLAPKATIDVYQGPDATNKSVIDVYSAIVNANPPDPVVSTSWGECEPDQDTSDSSLRSTEESLFEQAAAQGQSVFAAGGDTGSTDCYGDPNSPNTSKLTVDDPASQVYVVGVGGTSLHGGGESVWNDPSGAGGGGVSSTWCMPGYQDQPNIPGIISSASEPSSDAKGANCPAGSYMREVPDISADADLASGYVVYWNGLWTDDAGTSGAAPLAAAGAALIDSSPFCADYGSGNPGMLPQGLYAIANLGPPFYGLAFDDLTTGDNDWTPSQYSGGLYRASVGYDMASGLGAPRFAYSDNYLPGLAAQMCARYATRNDTTTISRLTPDLGPTGAPTTVTISGTGFMPLPGADRLQIGSTQIPAYCSSPTSCTATLPATTRRTVNLQMSVQESRLSPPTSADEFTFVPRPSVGKLVPDFGPERAGTKVTLWGNGFAGQVSVRFGTKAATGVRVISPGEITLSVPAGNGDTKVTVSTVGGTNRQTTVSRYRFLAAPKVSIITPPSGPPRGGTKVTIWGSSFVGTVSVRFGARPATHVHVISSSRLTVDAPPGSGTVYVTVSTVGGLSRQRLEGRYHY